MQNKFENFLNRLKTDDNKVLIETIEKGFKAITENYGDFIIRVDRFREEQKVPALDTFNDMAAMTAHSMGNEVLNFLKNSRERYNHLYTVDDEPELDYNPTSEFNQYVAPHQRNEIEDSLGLTSKDLSVSPSAVAEDDWDIFTV